MNAGVKRLLPRRRNISTCASQPASANNSDLKIVFTLITWFIFILLYSRTLHLFLGFGFVNPSPVFRLTKRPDFRCSTRQSSHRKIWTPWTCHLHLVFCWVDRIYRLADTERTRELIFWRFRLPVDEQKVSILPWVLVCMFYLHGGVSTAFGYSWCFLLWCSLNFIYPFSIFVWHLAPILDSNTWFASRLTKFFYLTFKWCYS